ncbi:uncharacterized protein VTP21DRAFT_6756 [Calcarisporiella thermophila]|uniref:uncharacterized protein n=1 Tax=Calcarisporiella thermophila TaxID=911321 RepID=UPI0037433E0D
MQFNRQHHAALLTVPLRPLPATSFLLVKFLFRDADYIILATDLKRLWYEAADENSIGQKIDQSQLGTEIRSFLSILREMLERPQKEASIKFSDEKLIITLTRCHGLVEIVWDFVCTAVHPEGEVTPEELFFSHVTLPLAIFASAAYQQVNMLEDVAHKKDREIIKAQKLLKEAGYSAHALKSESKDSKSSAVEDSLKESISNSSLSKVYEFFKQDSISSLLQYAMKAQFPEASTPFSLLEQSTQKSLGSSPISPENLPTAISSDEGMDSTIKAEDLALPSGANSSPIYREKKRREQQKKALEEAKEELTKRKRKKLL